MVTANHILGHLFAAFVAMGIGVFRSFVFCEKTEVLFCYLPWLTHQNVLRMEGGCGQPHRAWSKMFVPGTGLRGRLS